MEDGTVSLINSVPSFARGFNILLVHNDPLSLSNLSSLLQQYSFKVTATHEASVAVSMICDQAGGQFNLAIAKADMPGIDTLSFQHILLEKDIPVIFISSGTYDDLTGKALAKGSCYFLEEPILLQDLKYVWQQVYHTKQNSRKETQNANCEDKVHGTRDDSECMQMEKIEKSQMNLDSNHHTAEEEREKIREHTNNEPAQKKTRLVWTSELHQKFKEALSVLGDKNVRPKNIQQLMNVPDLTTRHVASHLQKYKSQVQSIPPNLSGRSQYSSPFESQSYPGFSASNASLSENQNLNQFLVNFTETRGSDILQMMETPGIPTFPYGLPTNFTNYGSQNLEAVGVHAVLDASMDQIQNIPLTAYDKIKMLEEDCVKYDCYQNGLNPDDVDQYSEMLRNVIHGNSSSPQELDI